MAHLIMGDGTAVSGGIRICTDSFTVQDVVKLGDVLTVRYGLTISLQNNRGNYRIFISRKSMPLLIPLIKPFMVKSMYYKLSI